MSPLRRRIFFEPALSNFQECVWRPAVDVQHAPYGWLIKAELAGVAPEAITVRIQGNSLVLSGVRRDTLSEEGCSYYAMEISYCRFERRIQLPQSIEGAELRVSSRDGLLILKVLVPETQPQP